MCYFVEKNYGVFLGVFFLWVSWWEGVGVGFVVGCGWVAKDVVEVDVVVVFFEFF